MSKYLIFLLIPVFLFSFFNYASADAWWGKGYRSPEWVLVNGGALIYYSIKGAKDKNKVKAKLVINGKTNVEREYGPSGVFDDALPGQILSVKAMAGSKEASSPSFTVRAGETKYVRFTVKGKKIKYNDSYSTFRNSRRVSVIKKEKWKIDEETKEKYEKIHEENKFKLIDLNLDFEKILPEEEKVSPVEEEPVLYQILPWVKSLKSQYLQLFEEYR